jgi:hypothetical protein
LNQLSVDLKIEEILNNYDNKSTNFHIDFENLMLCNLNQGVLIFLVMCSEKSFELLNIFENAEAWIWGQRQNYTISRYLLKTVKLF